MNLTCKLCGKRVVVADDIVPGQHVRCPFCGGKFSYTTVSNKKKDRAEPTETKEFTITSDARFKDNSWFAGEHASELKDVKGIPFPYVKEKMPGKKALYCEAHDFFLEYLKVAKVLV